MKRLCILFFCALFTLFLASCDGTGTEIHADNAIFFANDDNYAVVIREKYVGSLRHGKIDGKVVGYEKEIIPLTLYAEGNKAEVIFDEDDPDTVDLLYGGKEVCLLAKEIRTDRKVFECFDGLKGGYINAKFLSGYGKIYYFCGYYEKEKLLYGVIFDEDFTYLSSIGSI